ncbi:hypothetical protein [Lentibacter algarum]|uniref:hypothetical protein n=1 Tax=Lentibacter algarum TaxID=576131 RepID=UPI002090D434|nr:hypothetical protein [Lentibacter algarum]
MVGKRKKYLWRHPSGRWYVRKIVNGKMIYLGRITAEEGTAEFDRQYWEILSGKKSECENVVGCAYRRNARNRQVGRVFPALPK